MTVNGLSFSTPPKRVSAWTAETDPASTRTWLASLPMADSGEAAREIYQALYSLNRQELDPLQRFALMELYRDPLEVTVRALQTHYTNAAIPLSPKRRQLAEFVRRLYVEMANGYKCCLHDLARAWKPWARRRHRGEAIERALRYLGEALLQSYLAYIPAPPGVWKEVHALYRYAESLDEQHEPVPAVAAGEAAAVVTVSERYQAILLLGLCHPYQLPQDVCRWVWRFLDGHARLARLVMPSRPDIDLEVSEPGTTARSMSGRGEAVGQFLVDLTADAPPTPYLRHRPIPAGAEARVLNTLELVRAVNGYLQRLHSGEPARALNLGVECLESVCQEWLRRLLRVWGLPARRRHSRLRRHDRYFVCHGIAAVHFFASGQRPFSPGVFGSEPLEVPAPRPATDMPFGREPAAGSGPETSATSAAAPLRASYRVERWQVRDIGPQGLLFVREGQAGAAVRVGEILGIQQEPDPERWSAAVVRWLRSPEPDQLEVGVEVLAPGVQPVAVRSAAAARAPRPYVQALWLPAQPRLHRPARLLVPAGVCPPAHDLELIDAERRRRVRVLKRLERSGAFELLVVADVAAVAHLSA